jgi:hypothetical protein
MVIVFFREMDTGSPEQNRSKQIACRLAEFPAKFQVSKSPGPKSLEAICPVT